MRPSSHESSPQVCDQFGAQDRVGLHELRAVDRLVRDPHRGILWEVDDQSAADLLRRPALPQLVLHVAAQLGSSASFPGRGRQVRCPASRSRAARYPLGPLLRATSRDTVEVERPSSAAIAREGLLLREATGDRLPLLQGRPQRRPGSSLSRSRSAGLGQPVMPGRLRHPGRGNHLRNDAEVAESGFVNLAGRYAGRRPPENGPNPALACHLVRSPPGRFEATSWARLLRREISRVESGALPRGQPRLTSYATAYYS